MIRFHNLRTIKLVQASFPRSNKAWHWQTSPFPLKNYSLGIATNGIINGRLKREESTDTEFDPHFSIWKPLTGPNDWRCHELGIPGVKRYRNQSLHEYYTGLPGVYELAAVPAALSFAHDEPTVYDIVIPLYIGVTNDLKVRLQQYGHNGAHLENGSSGCNDPRLFSGIFSRVSPIAFRAAVMKSKEEAQEFEDRLLKKYDYPWNQKRNGRRRPEDVHEMLDRCVKERESFHSNMGLTHKR